MKDSSNDISKELLFIENAILNSEDYNAASIEKKIDGLFELTIKKSEIETGANNSYIADFLTWKKKMNMPAKKQSLIFKEILAHTNSIIKDSKRVLKGKKPLNKKELDDSRFNTLVKELNSSFDEMKSLMPEGAILQYRKDLIDLHNKRNNAFLKSLFVKSILSFIIKIAFFFLSFYLAGKIESSAESKLGHQLSTSEKLFIAACLYFFFDKILEHIEELIRWSIIRKSFKDLKILINLIFHKDQSIIRLYNEQIEKLKKEFDSAISILKSKN